ncbi:MAG: hypothetical protein QM723_33010 [Myxococcaceae bacterium]
MTRSARAAKLRTRGQTLVLGCVTLLVMALMLMLSFNLTNAIHEKMRLQSSSDAMAYSVAVIEARSYNYYAYTNRSEAAVYVSMCTLHAYMAGISLIPSILTAAEISFFEIAAEEFAQCCECQPFCCAVMHCIHGIQAIMIALQYMDKSSDMADKVSQLDDKFNQSIEMLQMAVNLIHVDQLLGVIQTGLQYSMGSKLANMGNWNAKYASGLNAIMGAKNLQNYACGMEGSPLDDLCSDPGVSGKEKRSAVMADVVNASRPAFVRSGPPAIPLHLYFDWGMPNGQGYMNIQSDGMAIPIMSGWDTGVADNTDCSLGSLEEGKDICSSQSGFFIAQWQDGVGGMVFSAKIASDKNGGDHEPSEAHQSQHDKFTGIQSEDGMSCMMQGDCFINFRSQDNQDTDFNQPSAFGFLTQPLRVRAKTNADNPWELNNQHAVSMSDGQRGQWTLNMGPQGDGKAISKAKVYFHRFDSWQFAPTMFDPYWRAKLHPLKQQEAAELLGAVDQDGAITSEFVVEGDDGSL